ncbi:MAG TPA: HD domain-containing phosphohydrolase [Pedococcus sp.]|jgi:HD-GYP domain-containing protein (c-di-GMP phosphodiesterase class II)/DNA-binding CsgD family transcriptional regulator|nr:HD domain-containing phosphohydrolase [Pedococcus sp.]
MSALTDGHRTGVRRAEVLAALSISIDLGLGLPMEHVLRSSLVAAMLADELELSAQQRATVYYTNLVLWIGCHADSHEFSRWFGDDLAMRRDSYQLDWSGLPYLRYLLHRAGTGQPPIRRTQLQLTLMLAPRTRMATLIHSHCLSAGLMAERIGLDRAVGEAVESAFERWDGSGLPAGRRGDEIPLATRVVQLAETCEVHQRTHGTSGALAMATERSGTQFDPSLVQALVRCRDQLNALPDQDVWARALELAPDHDVVLRAGDLDALLGAIGDFADLKCPFTVGHSRAVAELAAAAATRMGCSQADIARVRQAGLVHDLGRMGVPNSVWEKAGPLTESDRERVRLYPYLTGRILDRVRGLEAVAATAQAHRERLDGSGYPRGVGGSALPLTQRILAAADSYRGSREHRPHRPALDADRATARLRDEVAAGRLDGAAVDAVLAVAGHAGGRRTWGPAGLTAREVEILGLLSRGLTSSQIAHRLVISPKTVRNHVEHIYLKAGVTNRTGAALFALEHGLADSAEDGAAAP